MSDLRDALRAATAPGELREALDAAAVHHVTGAGAGSGGAVARLAAVHHITGIGHGVGGSFAHLSSTVRRVQREYHAGYLTGLAAWTAASIVAGWALAANLPGYAAALIALALNVIGAVIGAKAVIEVITIDRR